MADEAKVIVKAGLDIPGSCPLLQNFLEFVWQHIDAPPFSGTYMNIPDNSKYLDVALVFKWSDTPVNTCKVVFERTYSTDLVYDLNLFPFHPPEIDNNNLTINYPIQNNRNISAIKVASSPVMDMILSYQNHLYVAYKINVIIHQIGALYMVAQRPSEQSFFERYWCRYSYVTIRFAVRSGYDLPWHRDSGESKYPEGREGTMFGTERKAGFITCGIYTNRPPGLPADEGGISFTRDRKVFTLFPRGGTCVTFLDPEVFHKVIQVRGGGTAEKKKEFIKRSAVFIEHFTNRERIDQNLPGVQPSFVKPSLPAHFRNAPGAFKFLERYFEHHFPLGLIEHGLDPNNIPESIRVAPNAVINQAYGFIPNGYPAYVQQVTPGEPLRPLPDFFVYKVRGTNGNTRKQKLLNLYDLYIEQLTNFQQPLSNNAWRNLGMTNAEIAEMRRPRYHPTNNAQNRANRGQPPEKNHQGFEFSSNFVRGVGPTNLRNAAA